MCREICLAHPICLFFVFNLQELFCFSTTSKCQCVYMSCVLFTLNDLFQSSMMMLHVSLYRYADSSNLIGPLEDNNSRYSTPIFHGL